MIAIPYMDDLPHATQARGVSFQVHTYPLVVTPTGFQKANTSLQDSTFQRIFALDCEPSTGGGW